MPKREPQTELEITFTAVTVFRRDYVLVSAIVDEYAEVRQDHALVCHYAKGVWKKHGIDNSIAGICVIEEPRPKVLNCGVDGEIVVATLPGFETEQVDTSEEGPSYSVQLRVIRKVGKHVYVAGLARQVYRREGPNRWVRWDSGVFVPKSQRKRGLGFSDIDGASETAIFAVGYGGEIWFFDGRKWIKEISPTNVVLNCVKCLPDGEVYVCGQAGVILRGRKGEWKIIEQDATEEDFWGLTHFDKRIWLSNQEGVFVLDQDELRQVDLRLGAEFSTCYLDASDGVLWSAGEKDLAFTEDGERWVEVSRPKYFLADHQSPKDAPVICAEGPGHSVGTHGQLHTIQSYGMRKSQKRSLKYMQKAAAGAVKKVFPESGCDPKCIEEQLKNYHEKQANIPPDTDLNPVTPQHPEVDEVRAVIKAAAG